MIKPPIINGNPEVQRAIDEIVRALNEISNRIPQESTPVSSGQSGNEGKIKIEKTNTNTYELSVKTDEGYVKTNMNFKEE